MHADCCYKCVVLTVFGPAFIAPVASASSSHRDRPVVYIEKPPEHDFLSSLSSPLDRTSPEQAALALVPVP